MSKIEELKKQSFFVMSNMAFLAKKDVNGNPFLEVVNLNKTTQILICGVFNNEIRFKSTNMSDTNKYKILLYIERNKDMILRHLR